MSHSEPLASTAASRDQSGRLVRVAGFVLAVLVVGGTTFLVSKPHTELGLYLRAAERMVQGEAVHRVDERAFSYPPLFALLFVPMTLLPDAVHRPLWAAINVAALVLIFSRLQRRLFPAAKRGEVNPEGVRLAWGEATMLLFWMLVIALAARHLLAPLENQSHDLLVFLCVLLAIDSWCDGKDLSVGWWAGAGAALKATPLLFLPLLLWHRRWKGSAVLLATLAALTLLPDWLYPANDGVSWTVTWYRVFVAHAAPGESPDLQNTWGAWGILNQSLSGTVHRLVTAPPPTLERYGVNLVVLAPAARRLLILLTQLTVLAWLAWVTRPALAQRMPAASRPMQRLGEGAAVVCGMVLLSPTSIKTHFCVLLLPIAFCVADFLRRRDPFVGIALLLTFVLGTLTVKDLLGTELGNVVLAAGTVTAFTLALYVATGRVLLQRAREYRLADQQHFPSMPTPLTPDTRAA